MGESKYPVPRMAAQVLSEWADDVAREFDRPLVGLTKGLDIQDFPTGTLRIDLMDGSFVQFVRAFHVVSRAKRAIAVFSEHCGHHVFPIHEARVFRNGVLIFDAGNLRDED